MTDDSPPTCRSLSGFLMSRDVYYYPLTKHAMLHNAYAAAATDIQVVTTQEQTMDIGKWRLRVGHIIAYQGDDSARATENFAPLLTEEPGQTSRFVTLPFRGLF